MNICKKCGAPAYKWNIAVINKEKDSVNEDFMLCHDCLVRVMNYIYQPLSRNTLRLFPRFLRKL